MGEVCKQTSSRFEGVTGKGECESAIDSFPTQSKANPQLLLNLSEPTSNQMPMTALNPWIALVKPDGTSTLVDDDAKTTSVGKP